MRLIILAILTQQILALCYSPCQQCSNNNDPYSCLTCFPDNATPYITTCPTKSDQFNSFVAPAVVITLLHLFLLSVGMGMYREIFENIQLVALVGLRYDFQGGSEALQVTNFAIVNSNNFLETYAYQFIAVLLILTIFLVIVTCTDKMVHSPGAALVRRKKIIFPIRVVTLTFNALLLSSLIQLVNINEVMPLQVGPFVLSVLGITAVGVMLVTVGVISNWKNFQIDDPNYYVLVEQMTNKKWYSKNNVFFSLLIRMVIICVYVGFYDNAGASGIVMILLQTLYTVYFIALIRFTKIRYLVATIISNVLTTALFLVIYIGSTSQMGSSSWESCKLAYLILLIVLAVLFFWVSVTEIIFRRERVIKQLKSFYNRFIKCEKLQEEIEVSKYDEHGHRERVREFHTNLLYQKDTSNEDRSIEMQQTSKQ